jgi:hypothetical protein
MLRLSQQGFLQSIVQGRPGDSSLLKLNKLVLQQAYLLLHALEKRRPIRLRHESKSSNSRSKDKSLFPWLLLLIAPGCGGQRWAPPGEHPSVSCFGALSVENTSKETNSATKCGENPFFVRRLKWSTSWDGS